MHEITDCRQINCLKTGKTDNRQTSQITIIIKVRNSTSLSKTRANRNRTKQHLFQRSEERRSCNFRRDLATWFSYVYISVMGEPELPRERGACGINLVVTDSQFHLTVTASFNLCVSQDKRAPQILPPMTIIKAQPLVNIL